MGHQSAVPLGWHDKCRFALDQIQQFSCILFCDFFFICGQIEGGLFILLVYIRVVEFFFLVGI